MFKSKVQLYLKAISNLLASNGSHVCGLAEELLLPSPALLEDHQQGNCQCRQHLAELTHVVTDTGFWWVGGLDGT